MTPAPPPLTARAALFLDLDGTLLELAVSPEAVVVPRGLPSLLQSLSDELEGALAIVTGRRLESVDALFQPWQPTGAGLHGLEFRTPGSPQILRDEGASAEAVAERLRARFDGDAAIEIEDKGAAVALHFRRAPERVAECELAMDEALHDQAGLRRLRGHCVFEVLPEHANKGLAVQRLMALPPFLGREPVYLGDDVTDEDAFRAVGALGGLCVKVGTDPSYAAHRLASPGEVREWLRAALRQLRSGNQA